MTAWAWLAACGGPVGLRGEVDPGDTVPERVSATPCDACGGDCLEEELRYAERYHAEGGVDYVERPPAGGPHDPCWAPFGVHPSPVPDERWVHDLEHGAIVLLHDCEGCEAEVAELAAFAETSGWVLVTPYEDLDRPFAALAWGFRLTLGCWDEAAVRAFHDAHVDRAPESVASDPPPECAD